MSFPHTAQRHTGTTIGAFVAFAVACSCLHSAAAFIEVDRCDLPKAVSRASPESYQFRKEGGRCEGVFAADVAAYDIDVVGYMAGQQPLAQGDAMLHWNADGASDVHLVAQDLISNFHYRMDTHLAGATRYLWPGDVRTRLQLRGDRIAILATAPRNVAGQLEEVAFAVHAGTANGQRRLIFNPKVPVLRPRLNITRLDASGTRVPVVVGQELTTDAFLADEAITVPLALTVTAFYRVDLLAPKKFRPPISAGPGIAAASIVIYVDGP
jgi:hypothetical protein